MFYTCLLRRANGDPTIFFCDWHVTCRRIQEPFSIKFLGQRWRKKFWSPQIDNPFNDGFGAKISIFFFQLNKMRDEAKTWWLVFGPDVASSYFFFKENPCCTWITRFPLVAAITVNQIDVLLLYAIAQRPFVNPCNNRIIHCTLSWHIG